MENTIRLFISGEQIMGEWHGPKAERLTRLWGTNVISISGVNYCDAKEDVIAHVQALNPEFEVTY